LAAQLLAFVALCDCKPKSELPSAPLSSAAAAAPVALSASTTSSPDGAASAASPSVIHTAHPAASPFRRGEVSGGILGSHPDAVCALSFSPDSKLLASGSYDGMLKLWSIPTGPTWSVAVTHDETCALAFDSAGKLLAVGSGENKVRIYDIASRGLKNTLYAAS